MRRVEPFVVSPSEDLALVAQRFAHRMPRLVRYVLDGLGTPDAQSADLMSYLLFDAAYTRTLVDIGYRDAAERIDEIESFFAASGALDSLKRKGRAGGTRATRPSRARAKHGADDVIQTRGGGGTFAFRTAGTCRNACWQSRSVCLYCVQISSTC